MQVVIVRRSKFSLAFIVLSVVAGIAGIGGCVHSQTPLEHNRDIAVTAVLSLFNSRDYESADRFFAPDFRSHNPQIKPGPEGVREFARSFAEGFPDFRAEILDTVAEGDKVVIRVRWHGTHTGTFAGVAPTGNRIQFEAVEILRVREGKLVEHWDVVDRLALRIGLGTAK